MIKLSYYTEKQEAKASCFFYVFSFWIVTVSAIEFIVKKHLRSRSSTIF